MSQRLIPKNTGGRIAICEILRSNSRTKEYVQEGEREGKSLQDAMEAGGLDGMQTFDQELERLIHEGTVDRHTRLTHDDGIIADRAERADRHGAQSPPIVVVRA